MREYAKKIILFSTLSTSQMNVNRQIYSHPLTCAKSKVHLENQILLYSINLPMKQTNFNILHFPDRSNPNLMAAPIDPFSHRIQALIHQLRLYKPDDSLDPGEAAADGTTAAPDDGDRDLDDRGKVFSPIGLAESASTLPEPFCPKRAAVLICLFEGDHGELRVILTKRSSNLSTHSGEVSLPGGKAEAGDADDWETATREAKEEIGLDPSLVTVVAVLEPFLSKHLLRVAPVIGVISSRQAFLPVPNAAEVETIFDAPLEMFLKDENHRSEERDWMGEKYVIHYFDYETDKKKFLIWGLTASILIHAASVVYQQQPQFPDLKPKFKYPTNIEGKLTMR